MIQDSSFGRAPLPWIGVNANEVMIRDISLTLEHVAESTAETVAAQQRQNP